MKEINPAPGYSYAEEITFTVNEDGTTEHVAMVDRPTRVTVTKVEDFTSHAVSGALLQILDEQGTIQESWVSDSDCYEITAKLCAGQRYYLHEEKAPAGYQRTSDLAFVVPRNGDELEISFGNHKIHYRNDSPDGSDTPQQDRPKKLGRITTWYRVRSDGDGSQIFIGTPYKRTIRIPRPNDLPRTGDSSHSGWYVILAGFALAGLTGVMILKTREKRKKT